MAINKMLQEQARGAAEAQGGGRAGPGDSRCAAWGASYFAARRQTLNNEDRCDRSSLLKNLINLVDRSMKEEWPCKQNIF